MKKYLLGFVILLILAFAISGCGSDGKATRGIRIVDGQTCYQIDLQGGAVEDYFTLVRPRGKVSVADHADHIVVSYSKISEGGWVVYYNGLVIYLPSGVDEASVQVTCAAFAFLDSSDYLTVDEAREYLPWLS